MFGFAGGFARTRMATADVPPGSEALGKRGEQRSEMNTGLRKDAREGWCFQFTLPQRMKMTFL